ncbi:MAG: glycosyltransferase family 4 protein [Flavobacteriales bacterium]|jgi:glycosyltransferase involved in cell wall biosynthesis
MSRSELHIALCTDGVFPQAMGGMQRHSRLLAEELARTPGVRLTVIHPHTAPIFDAGLGITEVSIAPIDPSRFYLRELWRYSERVAAVLDRISPDVVFSQGYSLWSGIERFSARLIVHPHGLEMFQGITLRDQLIGAPFRFTLRHILRRAAVCISLGGRLTPILQRQVRGSSTRVVTIPNAVHVPDVMPAYPVDNGPMRLLFVGRFAFNKGLDLLVSVARRLVPEGKGELVRFQLAGDGPLLAELKAAGLPANVELLGKIDDEGLFRAYQHCHALVLPTRFEGMPTVVLEAMAHARPVIVSDVGATAELVDRSNGRLLPKGDAEALYQAVLELAALPAAARAGLGRVAWERARENYTWPTVAARTVALAQELHQQVKDRGAQRE